MYDRFKYLCEKMGKTMKEVCKDLGISQGTVSNWRKRNSIPSGELLAKMSNYFDVTMDYLLTGQEPEATWDGPSNLPAFTIGELQLLEIYKQLSEEKQADMIKFGQFLLSRQAEERKKSIELSKEA